MSYYNIICYYITTQSYDIIYYAILYNFYLSPPCCNTEREGVQADMQEIQPLGLSCSPSYLSPFLFSSSPFLSPSLVCLSSSLASLFILSLNLSPSPLPVFLAQPHSNQGVVEYDWDLVQTFFGPTRERF